MNRYLLIIFFFFLGRFLSLSENTVAYDELKSVFIKTDSLCYFENNGEGAATYLDSIKSKYVEDDLIAIYEKQRNYLLHSGFHPEALSKIDSIGLLIVLLRGKSHPTYAYNKLKEGDILMKMDSINRSIKCYQEALKIFENADIFMTDRSDNLPYEEKCHIRLSNAYSQVLKDSLALYHNNVADSIHFLCKDDAIESYANILLQKGCIYRDMHDYNQMQEYYQQCYEFLCSEDRDIEDKDAADIIGKIVGYLLFFEKYDLAELYAKQEREFAEKSNVLSCILRALNDGLDVNIERNNLLGAHDYIILIQEKLGNNRFNSSEYFYALTRYIRYLLENKKFDTVWQILPELEEFEIEENSVDYGVRKSLVGQIYFHYGDIAKALDIQNNELTRRLKVYGENSSMYATALNNLSVYYEELGDYKIAIKYGEQALTIRKSLLDQSNSMLHDSMNNLSGLYSQIGEYEKCISLNKEYLKIASTPSNGMTRRIGEIMQKIGYAYLCADSLIVAFDYITKGLTLIENEFTQKSLEYARALSTFADYYYEIEDFESAYNTEKASLEIFKDLVGEENPYYISKLPKIITYAYMTDQLSVFNATLEQYNAYLINYSLQNLGSLDSKGQENFWKIQKDWFLDRLPFFSSMDTENSKLAVCTYDGLLFGKSLLLNVKNNKDLQCNWIDVKQSLSKDELAIEFGKYQYGDTINYIAVVVGKDLSAPIVVNLFNEKDLQKINAENQYTTPEAASLIWEPLDSIISRYNIIYFSPIGLLHTIAIESLPDYIGNGRISDRINFYRLTSTRELVNYKLPTQKLSAALFGNIDYSFDEINEDSYMYEFFGLTRSAMTPLPGTKREIETIFSYLTKAQYEVAVFTTSAATESSFKSLSRSIPEVIHVATHAFYWSEKDNLDKYQRRLITKYRENAVSNEEIALCKSGLLFAGANNILSGRYQDESTFDDGILTAKEVSNLDLFHVDLIALSACQTGLGEVCDEGVFGLQRGFKIAGVNSILMSLWEVDDDATSLLMGEFYNNLAKGSSKHESLNLAQKKVRETPGYEDPEYWAAFILLDALN